MWSQLWFGSQRSRIRFSRVWKKAPKPNFGGRYFVIIMIINCVRGDKTEAGAVVIEAFVFLAWR